MSHHIILFLLWSSLSPRLPAMTTWQNILTLVVGNCHWCPAFFNQVPSFLVKLYSKKILLQLLNSLLVLTNNNIWTYDKYITQQLSKFLPKWHKTILTFLLKASLSQYLYVITHCSCEGFAVGIRFCHQKIFFIERWCSPVCMLSTFMYIWSTLSCDHICCDHTSHVITLVAVWVKKKVWLLDTAQYKLTQLIWGRWLLKIYL